MTAIYTWDVFSSLDGFGSHHGDWGGYWGKQGDELLARRLDIYEPDQRMLFGGETFRAFLEMASDAAEDSGVTDPWVTRMKRLPASVVSNTITPPVGWPDATVIPGDAVDVVARLKRDSEVPLRSHGSLSLNRSLLRAGLVDLIQLTVYPVVTGQTGDGPLFAGAPDLDLELVESRTLDGSIQELTYRPSLHG